MQCVVHIFLIYEDRWAIERLFDTFKQGTCIGDRKLNTADDLRKCLGYDAISTWQVHELSCLARDAPDTPATEVVRPVEIRALSLLLDRHRVLRLDDPSFAAQGSPSVYDYVIAMGRIIGFRLSKRQALPGPLKCFKGDEKIQIGAGLIETMEKKGHYTPCCASLY